MSDPDRCPTERDTLTTRVTYLMVCAMASTSALVRRFVMLPGWQRDDHLAAAPSGTLTDDRCPTCKVSKQQVLGIHEAQRQEIERLTGDLARWHADAAEGDRLIALIHAAAPFVNAVAVMADDKTAALAWLADASAAVGLATDDPDDASPLAWLADASVAERLARRRAEGEPS